MFLKKYHMVSVCTFSAVLNMIACILFSTKFSVEQMGAGWYMSLFVSLYIFLVVSISHTMYSSRRIANDDLDEFTDQYNLWIFISSIKNSFKEGVPKTDLTTCFLILQQNKTPTALNIGK